MFRVIAIVILLSLVVAGATYSFYSGPDEVGYVTATVERGSIANLDAQIFASRVSEAKASVRVATATAEQQRAALKRAELNIANSGTNRRMADAHLDGAQAKLDGAERDYARKQALS